jgi:hypothetical protein
MRDGLLVVAVAAALMGCDSDCENVCEAAFECNVFSYLPSGFPFEDCGDMCEFQEDLADSQGCAREFDDYYGCLADGQRDECLFLYPCDVERAAYNACTERVQ